MLESGEMVTAHCANSGAMLDLKRPGSTVWVAKVPDHVDRKLRYDWHLIEHDGVLVGINTSYPNHLVEEALTMKNIPPLVDYTSWRREVKYGTKSRVDFLLEQEGHPPCYVEVKCVNHQEGDVALFPDAVTARGLKHLGELTQVVKDGARAVLLYIVQREDCSVCRPAAHIDPVYAAAAKEAAGNGVEFYAFSCNMSTDQIIVDQEIPYHHD
jgi:sugar fermentation stimulation protein A